MKKLCLLIALALACATSGALAETAATPLNVCGDFTYVLLSDGSAQIVDWDGTEAALAIPQTLDGHTVTSIGECAFAGEALTAIDIPATVREIGDSAFAGCAALMKVALSEGLERMGDLAFSRCEELTEIALPMSLNQIGVNPFERCANMIDIRVPDGHPCYTPVDGVLFSKVDNRLVSYALGRDRQSYAVPEGVRIVGAMAFDRNLYLEEVSLPDTVTTIERDAFYGCAALTNMNLPDELHEIGAGALDHCGRLTLTVRNSAYAAQYAQSLAINCVCVG